MDDKENIHIRSMLKKPTSIAIIIILVSVSIFSAYAFFEPKEYYHNPDVSFKVSFSGNPSPAVMSVLSGPNTNVSASPFFSHNMSNVSLRVFGTSPYLEVHGGTSIASNGSSPNGLYIELFKAMHAGSNGMINGSLSSGFHNIISQYSTIFSGSSGMYMIQSLDVDAQYQFAYQGKMFVYRYYNTLPFTPSSAIFLKGLYSYLFHLDIGFNMNQNPVIFNISNSAPNLALEKNAGQTGGGGGNLNCVNTVSSKITTYWGPYIINVARITNGYGMTGLAQMTSYNDFGWVNISSVQVLDPSSSGTIVGSNTAWGTGENVSSVPSANGVVVSSLPISKTILDENLSLLTLQGFEYGIIYQVVKVFAVNGSYCEYIGAYNQTTIKILNGNNDTLITKAGSPVVLYNLPSTITNNITLQNRYINDTGYMLNTFFTHKVMGSVNIPAGDTTSIFNYNFMSGTFSNSSTEYTKALEKKINVSSGKGINPFATGNFALGVEGIGMDIALIGLAAAVPTGGVGLAIKEAGAVMAGIGFAFDAAQSATVTYTFTWQNAAFSEMQLTNFAFSSDPGFTTYFYSSQSVIWDFPNGSSAEVNMPEPYFNMVAD